MSFFLTGVYSCFGGNVCSSTFVIHHKWLTESWVVRLRKRKGTRDVKHIHCRKFVRVTLGVFLEYFRRKCQLLWPRSLYFIRFRCHHVYRPVLSFRPVRLIYRKGKVGEGTKNTVTVWTPNITDVTFEGWTSSPFRFYVIRIYVQSKVTDTEYGRKSKNDGEKREPYHCSYQERLLWLTKEMLGMVFETFNLQKDSVSKLMPPSYVWSSSTSSREMRKSLVDWQRE